MPNVTLDLQPLDTNNAAKDILRMQRLFGKFTQMFS